MREWFDVKNTKPAEGQQVAVLCKNGELDKQFWFSDIAYYGNGTFWELRYDPHVGVLRKEHYYGNVDMWTKPTIPAYPD